LYKNILNIVISSAVEFKNKILDKSKLSLLRFNNKINYSTVQKPFISVYIPTYNRADILINRSVRSVLKQTYKNFELIIIGDRCSDDTEKKILSISDHRIKFFNLQYKKKPYPNTVENHWLCGPIIPANYALVIAKGDWIARIDDDEVWLEDHLEKLLNYALKYNYEFVTGNVEAVMFDEKKLIKGHKAFSEYFSTKDIKHDNHNPYIGGTSTWFYRSYLKQFKYNKHCWRKKVNRVNDIDLSVRFIKAGVKVGHLDDLVTYQYPRPGEDTVGWKAYDIDRDNKMEHFKS
jgi:glycosyltransferase involved in cell wall biosynthesis